jgi:hypothetical protein
MSLTLMTKLEAVNAMLESVWETPVSTLEVSGVGSVAMAKRVLDKTSIIVQTRGWNCNTDHELVLSPDSSGFINLGANCLHVDADGVDRLRRVVQRGTRLYDQENRTYVFTKTLSCKIVSYLDWDELPQALRSYISLMAARVFKDKWEHAEAPSSPTQEEIEALRTVEENDADSRDNNMFSDSWSVASILER